MMRGCRLFLLMATNSKKFSATLAKKGTSTWEKSERKRIIGTIRCGFPFLSIMRRKLSAPKLSANQDYLKYSLISIFQHTRASDKGCWFYLDLPYWIAMIG